MSELKTYKMLVGITGIIFINHYVRDVEDKDGSWYLKSDADKKLAALEKQKQDLEVILWDNAPLGAEYYSPENKKWYKIERTMLHIYILDGWMPTTSYEQISKTWIKLPEKEIQIDLSDIDIESITIDGVDTKDRPDFVDAYFSSANWKASGTDLTDDELDLLTDKYPELVNRMAHESLN